MTQLLTRSSSLPLLQNTCTHFISVILSTRGLIEGQDSYPVFHVNPTSTLAHTVAKIVATKSHRYVLFLICVSRNMLTIAVSGWPILCLPLPPGPQLLLTRTHMSLWLLLHHRPELPSLQILLYRLRPPLSHPRRPLYNHLAMQHLTFQPLPKLIPMQGYRE